MTTRDRLAVAPTMPARALPAIGADQAREMYALTEQKYHVPMHVLLEHGGRATAALVTHLAPDSGHVVVLAGKGLNGADALSSARHLLNAGWDVEIGLAVPPVTLAVSSQKQLDALTAHGADVKEARTEKLDFAGSALILDGLLGSNARGPPRPPMDALVREANAAQATRVSLDVPTGVDPGSGALTGDAFRAEATLMLGLPKAGTVSADAAGYAGALWLADVSLPRGVYAHFGGERPDFDAEGLILLER